MGRTIPYFRIALEMKKDDWKPFRNALDMSDGKKFDDMFDIPRLYTSACSYAMQPVRLYPILMSILLHHYKELTQCISEAERIEDRINSKNRGPEKEKEAEETKKKLAELEAKQLERFKEMEEKMDSLRKIALKQAFRVIEKEVEANPIPYIEGADKMTAQEVLYEMQKRGVGKANDNK